MTFTEAITLIIENPGTSVRRKSWKTNKYLAIYSEVLVIGLGATNVLYLWDLVADDWGVEK